MKVSNTKRKPLQSPEKVFKGDNSNSKDKLIIDANKVLLRCYDLSRELNISISCIYALLCLNESWRISGLGLTPYELINKMNYSMGLRSHLFKRLEKMRKIGYVDIVGSGRNQSRQFAPTLSMRLRLDNFLEGLNN